MGEHHSRPQPWRSPSDDAFTPGPPFDAARVPPAQLSNVNTTDIRSAIELGCRAMGRIFNPADAGLPYMYTRIWPDGWLGFSPYHGAIQMSGRHLDALLTAEAALGLKIDEDAVEQHTRASFASYRDGLPLPCNHSEPGGPLVAVDEHTIRESFHGLHALVRYRASDHAREIAEAGIRRIIETWSPATGWDSAAIEAEYGFGLTRRPTFVEGLGRSIGPLVKYHRATGFGPALELARLLAAHATNRFFLADGGYDATRFGEHTHSTTCVMSSLAQLADHTDDGSLLARVQAFYDHGLRVIRDDVGWVVERFNDAANPEQGEMNNVGDVIETALILGRRLDDRYYDDAERFLRAQLLPSQVRNLDFTAAIEGGDERRDIRGRLPGIFGFNAVYGHLPAGKGEAAPSLDIVGGAVASLCAVYQAVVRRQDGVTHVDLLFDHETDEVTVGSPYTGPGLRVTPRAPGDIVVRLPGWVDQDALQVDGAPAGDRVQGSRIRLVEPAVGMTIAIDFPLPEHDLLLRHRRHEIRARLRGDEVIAMDCLGAGLAFFPPMEVA
jgi:hypothetical protein